MNQFSFSSRYTRWCHLLINSRMQPVMKARHYLPLRTQFQIPCSSSLICSGQIDYCRGQIGVMRTLNLCIVLLFPASFVQWFKEWSGSLIVPVMSPKGKCTFWSGVQRIRLLCPYTLWDFLWHETNECLYLKWDYVWTDAGLYRNWYEWIEPCMLIGIIVSSIPYTCNLSASFVWLMNNDDNIGEKSGNFPLWSVYCQPCHSHPNAISSSYLLSELCFVPLSQTNIVIAFPKVRSVCQHFIVFFVRLSIGCLSVPGWICARYKSYHHYYYYLKSLLFPKMTI